jgi:predicted lactoylglutathione lyase
VFDIATRLVTGPAFLARGSEWLIAVGVAGALVAAGAGILDFYVIQPGTRAYRTVVVHMSLNLVAIVALGADFVWRYGSYRRLAAVPSAQIAASAASPAPSRCPGYLAASSRIAGGAVGDQDSRSKDRFLISMTGMGAIGFVTVEVADTAVAEAFYTAAFEAGSRVRVRASQVPTTGFRGFTMSLVVSRSATVNSFIDSAIDAGAKVLKPAVKSLWGYGGSVQAPDGTIWTVASSSKKDTGPATRQIDAIVLQLGVTDVAASKQFYLDHGLTVAKSYGSRYVELDTGPIKLTLNKRGALAKTAGVPPDGTGPHRLLIGGDAGAFTDPDGFVWEAPTD